MDNVANKDPNDRGPPELVDLPELLERFGWLTERRVRSMVADRAVQHWKVRNRLLFDPRDFQDLLDAGYVAPRS